MTFRQLHSVFLLPYILRHGFIPISGRFRPRSFSRVPGPHALLDILIVGVDAPLAQVVFGVLESAESFVLIALEAVHERFCLAE